MAAFDAGSIEARLTLDRSPFQEGLRLAHAEGEEFEGRTFTARADVDAADADTALAELTGAVDYLDGREIDVSVDVDAAAALSELEAVGVEADQLDGRTIRLDVDRRGVDAARGSVSGLLAAIVGLTPALAPLIGVAAGGLAGLSASFASAVGAAGAGGLAIVGAYKQIEEAQKALAKAEKARESAITTEAKAKAQLEYAIALKATQGPMAGVTRAYSAMNEAWAQFQRLTRTATFALIAKGIGLVASVLPRLAPLANAAVGALTALVGSLQQFTKSRSFTDMLQFFMRVGVPTLVIFGRVIGNFVVGLGELLAAFGPFSLGLSRGLLGLSQAFAAWAGNVGKTQGFQRFIAWLQQNGPAVGRFLVDLVKAFVHVGIAVAPIGSVVIKVLDGLARAINKIPTPVIGALAAVLVTLLPAVKIVQLLAGAWVALDAAMVANPIGITVAAIAALVVGLVYAYKHSETFRKIVNAAFGAVAHAALAVAHAALNVRDFFVAAWRDIAGAVTAAVRAVVHAYGNVAHAFDNVGHFFAAAWQAASAAVSAAWSAVTGVVSGGVNAVRAIVGGGLAAVRAVWGAVWGTFGPLVKAVLGLVVALVELDVRVLRLAISTFVWAVQSVWRAGWAVFAPVVRAAMAVVRAVVGAAMAAVRAAVSAVVGWLGPYVRGAMAAVRAVWSATWSAVRAAVSVAVAAVKSVVRGGVASVVQAVRGVRQVVAVVNGAFQAAVRAARDKVGALLGVVGGIGGRVVAAVGDLSSILYDAGRSVIQGLVNGIASMIGNVTGVLHKITSLIPTHKGPRARDLKLLEPAGRAIIQGLINGITKSTPSLVSILGRLTRYLAAAGAGLAIRRAIAGDERELGALARQRDRTVSRLADAVKRVNDLRQQFRQTVQTIAQGILQSSTLSQLGGETVQQLRDNLLARVRVVQQFAANIALLRKRHLNAQLLAQLAQEGPDQAGNIVALLAGAGKAQLAQFSALQRQLSAAANATGKTVAESMYGAGVAAARGIAKGIRSQLQLIVREMRELARAMVRAIRHGLRAHSPAEEMVGPGRDAGLGVLKGLASTRRAIEQLMEGLIPPPRYRLAGGQAPLPGQAQDAATLAGRGGPPAAAGGLRRRRTPIRLVVGKREFDAYIEELLDDHDDELADAVSKGAR